MHGHSNIKFAELYFPAICTVLFHSQVPAHTIFKTLPHKPPHLPDWLKKRFEVLKWYSVECNFETHNHGVCCKTFRNSHCFHPLLSARVQTPAPATCSAVLKLWVQHYMCSSRLGPMCHMVLSKWPCIIFPSMSRPSNDLPLLLQIFILKYWVHLLSPSASCMSNS